ncbi:hypothetical protein CSPX01_16840, partial [Colletotrichum filicis]
LHFVSSWPSISTKSQAIRTPAEKKKGSFSSFYLCLTSTTNTNQLSKPPPKHSSFVSLACTTGISKFVTEILRERTVAYACDNINKTTLLAIHDKMDLNFQLAARQVSACAL